MSVVRLARPADARAIAEVHVRSWQDGYRGIVPDAVLDGLSPADREGRWQAWLADPDNEIRTMVAEDAEGLVVGFVSVIGAARDEGAAAGVAEIPALYVDPSAWRSGVGTELLGAALAALRAAGAVEVTLWMLEDNARGRAFYTAAGFTPDGAAKVNPLGPREIRLRRSV